MSGPRKPIPLVARWGEMGMQVGRPGYRRVKVSKINMMDISAGGAEGDRTPDLIIANDALSQLSYSPVQRMAGI